MTAELLNKSRRQIGSEKAFLAPFMICIHREVEYECGDELLTAGKSADISIHIY